MNGHGPFWEVPQMKDAAIIPGYIRGIYQRKEIRKAETGFVGNLWNQRIKGDLSSWPQENHNQGHPEHHSSQGRWTPCPGLCL